MQGKRITDVPGLAYLWQVDNLYLAGQPSPDSWKPLKDLGITKIINLRGEGEMDFAGEIADIKAQEMEYEQFPIVVNGELSAENCKKLSDMIEGEGPHFIHCGSANRVGGWLITYLNMYKNIDFDEAVDIAAANGLTNPGFVDHARRICGL